MNREERIEEARRLAAERAPRPEAAAQKHASLLVQRLANIGPSQAQRHVTAAERSGTASYLDPAASPQAWDRAVSLARIATVSRAKRRDTITSGEVGWLVYDDLRMLLDEHTLSALALAVTGSDDVLLGSIIVAADSGKPSDDFLLEAMEHGFDEPLETLQRQVYEYYR